MIQIEITHNYLSRAVVVVAQLTKQSLPTPKDVGSDQAISNFCIKTLLN